MKQKRYHVIVSGTEFFPAHILCVGGNPSGDGRFSGHYGYAACFFWGTLRFFLDV